MTAHSSDSSAAASANVTSTPLPLLTRLWFAYVAFFRVLFDGVTAANIWTTVHQGAPQLAAPPAPVAPASLPKAPDPEPAKAAAPEPKRPDNSSALQLLALLQREGRLIDFLEQDIASFGDADIGAAVRVVHEGCRRALEGHVKVEPIRSEDEGAKLTLETVNPEEIKLTGNVGGAGPYKGTLLHRGWRATSLSLPEALPGHDAKILAAAEVEL